ncbi:piwi-like protein 1 isoform X1 [Octopus bimaculoides]|nr:piwi-like protein 1 isoform X1 [Octopus bimaculoides]|eukprot:XP_014773732.1 PREDICTED: piwi-like protein 1 isoform X1 [Octopus bimaculoides]
MAIEMNKMENFARGGRGATLLQALKKKQEMQKSADLSRFGRGLALTRAMEACALKEQSDSESPFPEPLLPATVPIGRGLAAMQALTNAAKKQPIERPLGSSLSSNAPAVGKNSSQELSRQSSVSVEDLYSPQHDLSESHRGTKGKKIPLSANYIRIKTRNEGVFQYHVSFNPEIDSKSVRYKMLYEHTDVTGKTRAFDGAILYLPIKLPNQETVLASTRLSDGEKITITIKMVKVLKSESCIPLYNIMFRRVMSILQMKQVGRYYYNPNTPTSVPQHKLEIWPGYITAIKEHEGGLLLMADASHKVLRKETVLDVLVSLVRQDAARFRDNAMRTIVGSVVLTRYNNKTYRVDDIAWDMSPNNKFVSSGSKESISFIEYYRKQYNREISDTNQPLLIHKPKKKALQHGDGPVKSELICLIPEFCYMTGLTDDMRSDFRVMKDIAAHTRVTPMQRQLTLNRFVESIKSNEDAMQQLTNWGLYFEDASIQIEGRYFQPERIIMRERDFVASEEADWGRDLSRASVITPVPLQNWVVITCKQDIGKSKDYISMMMKVTGPMGIDVSQPKLIETRDQRTETLIRLLRETIHKNLQLVVIIFPTSRDDKYSAVKKLCCVECPVPSQVIIARTISQQQKLRSVTQKIALQINCKLGGDLWALSIPLSGIMVIGIDVYHDSSKGHRSIGAFVASTNNNLTRWFSRVCFQQPNQELIDGLKTCLIGALKKYHEMNHILPKRIVVFRDGVSDSQLSVVSGYEVEQLSKCFQHFGDTYSPLLSVIIVQKRVNTRIFINRRNQVDNPAPGTIVDHSITRKNWYDFFLVSQHVRQGTVTPTHYIVVHDTSAMKVDHVQRLTYKMTHLYYNWPGTIRVPAPCQYAHKLAYLVGQNIHKEPSHSLADRLYFL